MIIVQDYRHNVTHATRRHNKGVKRWRDDLDNTGGTRTIWQRTAQDMLTGGPMMMIILATYKQ